MCRKLIEDLNTKANGGGKRLSYSESIESSQSTCLLGDDIGPLTVDSLRPSFRSRRMAWNGKKLRAERLQLAELGASCLKAHLNLEPALTGTEVGMRHLM